MLDKADYILKTQPSPSAQTREHTQMDDRDRVIIDSRDYAVHKHKRVILCDSASWMKKKTKLKEKATAKENQTNG